jgi:hypothetical protein
MDGVIAPMRVRLAGAAFLLDVRHFAAGRQLTISTDHAPACQRPKPEEPYQTHRRNPPTAMRLANDVPTVSARVACDLTRSPNQISRFEEGKANAGQYFKDIPDAMIGRGWIGFQSVGRPHGPAC